MKNTIFKPQYDKLFFIIWIPTSVLMLGATVFSAFYPIALAIMLSVDLFTFYFLVSPLFGYVELRENTLFIKFGFFIKREIPYEKIRGTCKERKFYSDSMLSLKSSFEHVNIKYNKFDVVTVSVVTNDKFIEELGSRL